MRLPVTNRRKVGMTSSHHAPYDLGYTRATMGSTTRSKPAKASESLKAVLSSDCSLQLDCTKLESLVIADQHAAVNTFPGLYTPPVTPWESAMPKAGGLTFGKEPSKAGQMTGVKS